MEASRVISDAPQDDKWCDTAFASCFALCCHCLSSRRHYRCVRAVLQGRTVTAPGPATRSRCSQASSSRSSEPCQPPPPPPALITSATDPAAAAAATALHTLITAAVRCLGPHPPPPPPFFAVHATSGCSTNVRAPRPPPLRSARRREGQREREGEEEGG